MAVGDVAPRAAITQVFPGVNACGLAVDSDILKDGVRLSRLRLMLAAVYEGAHVTGNTDGVSGPGDLILHRKAMGQDRGFIGPMETMSLAGVNKRLASLPKDPVRLLTRGPKVMQWLLVLRFRAQEQHIRELERLEEVVRAIVTRDPMYDGYLLELFVPEADFIYDEVMESAATDAGPVTKTDMSDVPLVSASDLRKKISSALSFELDPPLPA